MKAAVSLALLVRMKLRLLRFGTEPTLSPCLLHRQSQLQRPLPRLNPPPIPTTVPSTPEPINVVEESTSGSFLPWHLLLIGVAVTVLLFVILLHAHVSKRKLVLTVLSVLLLFALAALLLALTRPADEENSYVNVPSPTPTPTAVPTEAPTPTPTNSPVPTPEPTPEPTVAPITESFISDFDNGYWFYQNEGLKIEINRIVTDKPLVYFVAHIYMQDFDSFRPVFGNEGRSGHACEDPWRIARRYDAVLMITGDNMLNMDTEYKGILVRDGRVYQKSNAESFMALHPDTLSMSVYDKYETPFAAVIQNGYENTFSFGPILIRDGVVNRRLISSRLWNANPRCGLGMVEEGHLVAIVADGRRRHYSVGMTLGDFAELFAKENCITAYNHDGGLSTCMVFMGEQLNEHGNIPSHSLQRRVPDALMWGYSQLVPSLDDPIYHNGISDE